MGMFSGEAQIFGNLALTLLHKDSRFPYSINITYTFGIEGTVEFNVDSKISRWVEISDLYLLDCCVENTDNYNLPSIRYVYEDIKDLVGNHVIDDFKWLIKSQLEFHKAVEKIIYNFNMNNFPIIDNLNRSAIKAFLLKGNDAV